MFSPSRELLSTAIDLANELSMQLYKYEEIIAFQKKLIGRLRHMANARAAGQICPVCYPVSECETSSDRRLPEDVLDEIRVSTYGKSAQCHCV